MESDPASRRRAEIPGPRIGQGKLICCRFAVWSRAPFLGDRHVVGARIVAMTPPMIRPARREEYAEVARVWMDSWSRRDSRKPAICCWQTCARAFPARSKAAGAFLWPMMVDALPQCWPCACPTVALASYSSPRTTKVEGSVSSCLLLRGLPDEIWLRCVRENERAWRWYERERFVFEKEEVEPMTGRVMKHYRWKREGIIQ